jgi:hypothetical protein
MQTRRTEGRAHDWELLPHFILRHTGFPFELVERLRLPSSRRAVEELLETDASLASLRRELEEGLHASAVDAANAAGFDKRQMKRLFQVRKAAQRGCPAELDLSLAAVDRDGRLSSWVLRWNEALRARRERGEEVRALFERELRSARRALRDIAEDARFQQAVFLSNPDSYSVGLRSWLDRWDEARRGSRAKYAERMLWKYVQRFCAKNDTVSDFGPMSYGTFSAVRPGFADPELSWSRRPERRAFLAYWVVEELARVISGDPELKRSLAPSLNPLCQLQRDGRLLVLGSDRAVALSPLQRRLLELADGERTLDEIRRRLETEHEKVAQALDALIRAGLLRCRIEIPASAPDALAHLSGAVAKLPAEVARRGIWLDVLRGFEELRRRFAGAAVAERERILSDAEHRFEGLAGVSARRGKGRMYADRTMLYEECASELDHLELGRDLADRVLERLEPALDFMAGAARAVQARLRSVAAAALRERFGEGEIPYVSAMKHLESVMDRKDLPSAADLPPVQALLERIAARAEEHVVRLTAQDLPVFDGAGGPALMTSPDLMLLADDFQSLSEGRFQIVLGEVHPGILVWGELTMFHPDPERLRDDVRRLIERASPDVPLVNLGVSRHHKNPPFEYPGRTVELFARSAKAREEVIPAAHLVVGIEGGGALRLRDGGSGRELQLFLGDRMCLFSPPEVKELRLRTGKHTPRIEIEGLVYQRESWRLGPPDFPALDKDGFELFRRIQEFRRALGMPLEVFVRSAAERKPLHVDFENPFSVELLAELFGKGEELELAEMLPDSRHLWLVGKGGRHTCELRTTVFGIPRERRA